MMVKLSKDLQKIYTANHKNWDYSLDFLLGSLDLNTCETCISIVGDFSLSGEKTEVEIDDLLIEKVERFFSGKNDEILIEKLLWVAVLLPEI